MQVNSSFCVSSGWFRTPLRCDGNSFSTRMTLNPWAATSSVMGFERWWGCITVIWLPECAAFKCECNDLELKLDRISVLEFTFQSQTSPPSQWMASFAIHLASWEQSSLSMFSGECLNSTLSGRFHIIYYTWGFEYTSVESHEILSHILCMCNRIIAQQGPWS